MPARRVVIRQIGKWYILFLIDNHQKSMPWLGAETSNIESVVRNKQLLLAYRQEHQSARIMPRVDIDSWLGGPQTRRADLAPLKLRLKDFIKDNGQSPGSVTQVKAKSWPMTNQDWMWLLKTPISEQISTAKAAIEMAWRGTKTNGVAALLEILYAFDAIVSLDEIRKYKQVAAQVWNETQAKAIAGAPPRSPCGICFGDIVEVFSAPSGPWIQVLKTTLNRHNKRPEPNLSDATSGIVVGMVEPGPDGLTAPPKFKTRAPKHGEAVVDSRLIERGIVCQTKSKVDLEVIVAALTKRLKSVKKSRASATTSKPKKDSFKLSSIRNLCDLIFHLIVELETLEVSKPLKEVRQKWLFSWWD
jgi:hypothetical protein